MPRYAPRNEREKAFLENWRKYKSTKNASGPGRGPIRLEVTDTRTIAGYFRENHLDNSALMPEALGEGMKW